MTPRRAFDLLASLGLSDMKVRYGRGPWQLLKWLIDPFALTGVYLALVVFVLDRPGRAPGLSLACAVVPFQLVMTTVITSLDAIRTRATIISNMAFPRMFIPLAAAFTESMAYGASCVLLVLMMAVYGIAPTSAVVWLPLVVFVNVAFASSISYPSALFTLWLPDLRTFAISIVRTAFFVAPGLVPLSQIHGKTHDLIRFNPLTGLFESYRSVLLRGEAPDAWMILIPLAFAVLLVAIFVPIYRREQDHLAKLIE
jgi:lipopolysaccharide transport system permease protein